MPFFFSIYIFTNPPTHFFLEKIFMYTKLSSKLKKKSKKKILQKILILGEWIVMYICQLERKLKKSKKKIWKKYHSINLFIFDFSIVSKKFKTEIQAKTLSLPRQIDENFTSPFSSP